MSSESSTPTHVTLSESDCDSRISDICEELNHNHVIGHGG